ncbi:MAG: CDP-alcohol phosphatidyltransferase family protein [Proteobacteria bacterium]|nr:CDP-alcohol phosphatidyltransferase family protein [Pseudomonadota bacterium]
MIATADVASSPAPTPRVVSKINPANAVTASRFLTLPPFVWAVYNGYHQWATLFILICGLLDKLDGLAAKVFDCRSNFGELFDAITDGICYGFALIIVMAYGWAPLIPCFILILLGGVNSGLRAVYIKRCGRNVNYKSYAMERVVGFIAYLIGMATANFLPSIMFWTFVPIMVIVVAHDAKRMLLDPVPT